MNRKFLIAAVAVAGLTAGAAQAADTHRAGAYSEPSQPIAYGDLKAYLKASPKERMARDWSGAATGSGVNASATTPATVAPMSAGDRDAPASVAPDTMGAPPPVSADSVPGTARSNSSATSPRTGVNGDQASPPVNPPGPAQ